MSRQRARIIVLAAFLICIGGQAALATVIHVPKDEPTIQDGIDAAGIGDTVLVAPGAYTESIVTEEGGFTLLADGEVILTAAGDVALHFFPPGPVPTTIVSGFIFEDSPGALRVDGEIPLNLLGCTFRNNSGPGPGVAIFKYSETELVAGDCLFSGNVSESGAAAAQISLGSAMFRNCVFTGNSAGDIGGALYFDLLSGEGLVEDCVFAGNAAPSAGTILADDCISVTVRGSTFHGNGASEDATLVSRDSYLVVENSIFAGSTAGAAFDCQGNGVIFIACTDAWGNAGGDWTGCAEMWEGFNGNFSLDPLFCDASGGDLTLFNVSPCLPENNSCDILIGALGQGCSLTATDRASWSALKSLY